MHLLFSAKDTFPQRCQNIPCSLVSTILALSITKYAEYYPGCTVQKYVSNSKYI